MIREHPRFQKVAIIFISAILLTDVDRLRGYRNGRGRLRTGSRDSRGPASKVKVSRAISQDAPQQLNRELERRVAERTAELEMSTARLMESERRRTQALAAGRMGSWEWDMATGNCILDEGQHRIAGVDPKTFKATIENVRSLIHRMIGRDCKSSASKSRSGDRNLSDRIQSRAAERRAVWCIGTAARSYTNNKTIRVSASRSTSPSARRRKSGRLFSPARWITGPETRCGGQSIVRLTHANSTEVQGCVEAALALARAHGLLSGSVGRALISSD